jgi:hypothetical protein
MLKRIEILVEEPSMEAVLKELLPKILPAPWELGVNCFIRSHEGKSDLKKSIPKKMKVFSHFYEPTGIVILHDQDSADCKKLKQDLLKLCTDNGNCPVLIRIICRELEAWYIGDFEAVQAAYPKFKAEKNKQKATYRNPNALVNASEEVKKLVPDFQKGSGAKRIAPHLSPSSTHNTSESFQQFLSGLKKFLEKNSPSLASE